MVHTIDETIKEVCVQVKGVPVCIKIRRSHLLKDTLKESRKAKFKPASPLMVQALFCIHFSR